MSEQDMDTMDYGDESDHDLIYTEMLEDILKEIRPIQTLIEENHVIKYAIVLGKVNRNGKDR